MNEGYYVMRVKYLKDGTVKKSEVMDYTSRQKAIAKCYSNLGADMVDETLAGGFCTVLNGHGGREGGDFWIAEGEEISPDLNA